MYYFYMNHGKFLSMHFRNSNALYSVKVIECLGYIPAKIS